jgi:hypothetical protein
MKTRAGRRRDGRNVHGEEIAICSFETAPAIPAQKALIWLEQAAGAENNPGDANTAQQTEDGP